MDEVKIKLKTDDFVRVTSQGLSSVTYLGWTAQHCRRWLSPWESDPKLQLEEKFSVNWITKIYTPPSPFVPHTRKDRQTDRQTCIHTRRRQRRQQTNTTTMIYQNNFISPPPPIISYEFTERQTMILTRTSSPINTIKIHIYKKNEKKREKSPVKHTLGQ